MRELLLPRTDLGVLVQVVVLVVVVTVALRATWRRPELRLLVIGTSMLVFGLVGLRAAH